MSLLPFWLMSAALVVLVMSRPSKVVGAHQVRQPQKAGYGGHDEGESGRVNGQTIVIGALALLPLALTSSRNVPAFLLLAAPALASLVERRFPSPAPRRERRERPIVNLCVLTAAGVTFATIIAYGWSLQIPRLQWRPLPDGTISAVRACPGRLYNNYDDGGYLIWFVRERKVFVDNRLDPYPAALVDAHIDAELSGNYQALFERYQIQCALTRTGSPLAERLTSDGWRSLHTEVKWQVLSR